MKICSLLTAILVIAVMAAEGIETTLDVRQVKNGHESILNIKTDKDGHDSVLNIKPDKDGHESVLSTRSDEHAEESELIWGPENKPNPSNNEPAAPSEEGQNIANYKGEPSVSYYTPAGYASASGEPLLIRKKIVPLDRGMGVGNRLKVVVEVTKRDKKREEIEDLDIYEYVDDYLNLISLENGTLMGFDKLNSAEDMGELMDDLYRPDSPYYYRGVDLREEIFPVGSEPDLIYRPPSNIDPHIAINWYNISLNGSKDREKILNLLKDDFGVKWANPESSSVSPILYEDNKSVIYINGTEDNTDKQVQIRINSSATDTKIAELIILNRTTYYLNVDNETTKGRDLLWIYDWNGMLRLHVNHFSSKDRLFYWYYIKPKKSGVFNTASIVKIRDEDWAGWPDIINPLDIVVSEPDLSFEVTPIMGTNRVYANEKLRIRYIVNFTGGMASTYKSNINCTFYDATDEFFYIDEMDKKQEKIGPKFLDFSENNYNFSDINISYKYPGMHQIPAIWIEGRLYIPRETITADTFVVRNKELIYFFIAISSFFMGLIFNKELKNKLRNIFNHIGIWIKGGESPKIDDEYANARDDAAKEMACLIIEALERKGKD
jgi:hypothetical protein